MPLGQRMREVAVFTRRISANAGIDLSRMSAFVRGLPAFFRDASVYRKQADNDFPLELRRLYPFLTDKNAPAGCVDAHYFHQDLWAATEIYKANPGRHVDIGSRVDGFISHLLVFREVEVVDIRPLHMEVKGLRFTRDDATELRTFADDSVESLSSLHASEHFGLGRYGDAIDPSAWRRFARSLARVLKRGGKLYFSVPCGRQRVLFNAHRIFHPQTVIEAFAGLTLLSMHGVLDDGRFYRDLSPEELGSQQYGCGCFTFTK
jgi:SAM-dependent methyltransferase